MKKIRKVSYPKPIIILVALTLLLGVLPLAAQPRGEFRSEVAVNEVLLDVLVTDAQGHVVMGLDENDFTVLEDGEPVEVTDVAFYSNRQFLDSSEKARQLGINKSDVPLDRYFILFFHDQRLLLPRLAVNLLDAGRRAKQWVMSDLLPNDYVAVASFATSLNLQGFTNDKDAIVAAIDQAVQGEDFSRRATPAPAHIPSITADLPRDDVDRIYDALAVTAEAAGRVKGRKNLVLFSLGFGEHSAFGLFRPDPRFYPDTIQALNDNNVAVYAIDVLGTNLGVGGFDGTFLESSLSSLAQDTGGRFYYNFVNFLTPLEQVSADNNGYYLLSYRSPHDPDEEGYQRVEVNVDNPEFDARARRGYLYGKESS